MKEEEKGEERVVFRTTRSSGKGKRGPAIEKLDDLQWRKVELGGDS